MGLKVRVKRHDEFDLGEHVHIVVDPSCRRCRHAMPLDGAEGVIVDCPYGDGAQRVSEVTGFTWKHRHADGHVISVQFYEPQPHPDAGLLECVCLHWSELRRLEYDGWPE